MVILVAFIKGRFNIKCKSVSYHCMIICNIFFRETKEENRKQSHHSFCPFSYPNNLHTVPNICPPFLSCTSKTSVLPVCHKCVPKYFGTISLSVILTALSHLPFSSSSMMKTLKWVERKREEGEKTFPLRRGSLRVCY